MNSERNKNVDKDVEYAINEFGNAPGRFVNWRKALRPIIKGIWYMGYATAINDLDKRGMLNRGEKGQVQTDRQVETQQN